MAKAAEVRLLPFTHQLKVQRLLAEGALGRGVGLQLQAHLLPGVYQPLCGGKKEGVKSQIEKKEKIHQYYCNKTTTASYQQSISSYQGCGEVLERYAEAHLPWQQWDS